MSELNDVLEELIDLRGYMTALMVKFPEMPLKSHIDFIDELTTIPSPHLVQQAPDVLYSLRKYFNEVIQIDSDMEKQLKPPLLLIEHLLSADQ